MKPIIITIFGCIAFNLVNIFGQYDVKLSEKNNSGNSGFGESLASAGDVNGDGYNDLIIGAYQSNTQFRRAYLYFGGNNFDDVPDLVLESEIDDNGFAHSVSSAGDINNDGFDDIIVGDFSHNNTTGCVYLYFGGNAIDSIADIVFKGETSKSYFGISVAPAGDVNNDGFDDIIVGAYYANDCSGKAYIYFGGINMDTVPDVTLTGERINSYFGYSVASAGDVNNDGISDVIVGAYGYFDNIGRAYIYLGGTSMDSICDVLMEGEEPGDCFGKCVTSAGDMNNDGFNDVVVGAYSRGRAYIFLGNTAMDSIADNTLFGDIKPEDWEADYSSSFGSSVSYAGDINNDGFDDIIIGGKDRSFSPHLGLYTIIRSYIFYGSSNLHDHYDHKISFGYEVSNCGDLNNDGIDDIVIGDKNFNFYSAVNANHYNINTGRVNIYYGDTVFNTEEDVILYGEGSDNEFGYSLSSAGDINNDGYEDMIIGANGYGERTGRAFIYYGGDSLNWEADIILQGQHIHDRFGVSVASAGDVNNDGFDDVLVGADNYNWYMDYSSFEYDGTGAVFLYFGGNIMDSIPDIIFEDEGYSNAYKYGYYTSSAGDNK